MEEKITNKQFALRAAIERYGKCSLGPSGDKSIVDAAKTFLEFLEK